MPSVSLWLQFVPGEHSNTRVLLLRNQRSAKKKKKKKKGLLFLEQMEFVRIISSCQNMPVFKKNGPY